MVDQRKLNVLTDHKPLIYIWKSFNHENCPASIFRWFVYLSSLDITVQYIPGRRNLVADWLSRGVESSVCNNVVAPPRVKLIRDDLFCKIATAILKKEQPMDHGNVEVFKLVKKHLPTLYLMNGRLKHRDPESKKESFFVEVLQRQDKSIRAH